LSGTSLSTILPACFIRPNGRLLSMTAGVTSWFAPGRRRICASNRSRAQCSRSIVGRERSVRSLSGRRVFMASLALALVSTRRHPHMAGGTAADALFVDEGFGSLDAETTIRSSPCSPPSRAATSSRHHLPRCGTQVPHRPPRHRPAHAGGEYGRGRVRAGRNAGTPPPGPRPWDCVPSESVMGNMILRRIARGGGGFPQPKVRRLWVLTPEPPTDIFKIDHLVVPLCIGSRGAGVPRRSPVLLSRTPVRWRIDEGLVETRQRAMRLRFSSKRAT
jgi:hypothetical protein